MHDKNNYSCVSNLKKKIIPKNLEIFPIFVSIKCFFKIIITRIKKICTISFSRNKNNYISPSNFYQIIFILWLFLFYT
eukprot:UN17812